MDDAKINEVLNSLNGVQKAPIPDGFQEKVMNRWHVQVHAQKPDRWIYWAAASLLAFTVLNGWAFFEMSSPQEDVFEAVNTETQFSEEYKLVKTPDYYTFNETTK